MNDFIIRPAGLQDMGAVNALLRQVLKVHHDGRPDLFREEGKKYTDEELQGIFANPETPVFVYESDGTVLGYVFCALRHPSGGSLNAITTLYIDDLCVDETARGKGVATALYRHVLDFAKANGCYNVTLNVWTGNDGALAFYQKMGMQPQKTKLEAIVGDL